MSILRETRLARAPPRGVLGLFSRLLVPVHSRRRKNLRRVKPNFITRVSVGEADHAVSIWGQEVLSRLKHSNCCRPESADI